MVLSSLSSTFLNLIKMKFIALSPQVGCHDQPAPLSLVEECRGLALIGREVRWFFMA